MTKQMSGKVAKETESITHKTSEKFVIGGSEEDVNANTEHETQQVVPPDGGWGWVVVIASFFCNLVVDGVIFTAGMLFPILTDVYKASYSEVAWIASLLGGFYLLAGPFVSSLANAFGFRTVCILGAVVSAVASGVSFFATSLSFLYVSFGIITGIGFGCIYVPAVIATGFYFEKRRAFATGIGVCGSGIGTFVFPPLILFVLNQPDVDWRFIFVVYAAATLLCAVFGLAFRPLNASTGKVVTIEASSSDTPLMTRIKRNRDQELAQCPSAISITDYNSRYSSKAEMDDVYNSSNGEKKELTSSLVAKTLLARHSTAGLTSKRLSVPGVVAKEGSQASQGKSLDGNRNETIRGRKSLAVPGLDANSTQRGYSKIASAPHLSSMAAQQNSSKNLLVQPRPFDRDDAFYTGSMARIPQYANSVESLGYYASVTRLPVPEQELNGRSPHFLQSAFDVFKKIFDFSLLSSITFVILAVTGFMALFSLFVPFSFLVAYTKEIGVSAADSASLMSLIGIFNTIGRIIAGWVSDHPRVDALMVNNLALIIGGTATFCLPFITNIYILYCYSVIFGLSVAAFASLRSILLVELLGLEKLTNSFGLLLLFQGIAGTFGAPIAGAFIDTTESYVVTFTVFGAIFALSGILCIPLRKIKQWEEKKIEKKIDDNKKVTQA